MSDGVHIEIVDSADHDGPINVMPESWGDEKPHELLGDWSDRPCWCAPHMEGNRVIHRSIFDAFGGNDE